MTATAESAPAVPALKKSKGGRPRLAIDVVRLATIGVRVNHTERTELEARAAAAGLKPGELLRQAGLQLRMPASPAPAVNRAEYARLGLLASNLNQIARAANAGLAVSVDQSLLDEIQIEISQLRLALLTGQ